jgi:preprotein translocase subunit SecY
MIIDKIADFAKVLPEVKKPTQQRVPFNTKLKWTVIMLVAYFILTLIPLFGLGERALQQFESLSVILGASFGSLMSLGIGPIVTASIILQVLVGADILKIDMSSPEGKKKFQALQKIFAIIFVIVEGAIYVYLGGLSPAPYYDPASNQFIAHEIEGVIALSAFQISALKFVLFLQVCLGGFLVILMDDVVSKWGFGSGISLFIVAGVSRSIFLGAFSWIKTDGIHFNGALLGVFQALSMGEPGVLLEQLSRIVFTVLVFVLAVYLQSMKIEIPLSPGRVRGYAVRWPLNFIYTSNIPVILTATLLNNIAMFSGFLVKNPAVSNQLQLFFSGPSIIQNLINGSFSSGLIGAMFVYLGLMVGGAILFSLFWAKTSGMDPASQADQIIGSGLQIPGFRRDKKILERILSKYIWPLTVLGGASVGFLAAFADMTNALSRGTGILLSVMIVYKLYEEITREHAADMPAFLRKFFKV